MIGFTLLSAVLIQACVSYGHPDPSEGVGAFAYQDTIGNRYGGTYGLKDGQVVNVKGDYPPPEFLGPPQWGGIPNVPFIPDVDNFFPEYFRNFEYLIQQAFGKDLRKQKLALNAARRAYDLTYSQAGTYSQPFNFPHSTSRFPPFPSFGNRNGLDMSQNSAFAGAAAGPGFSHQIAAISPENPQNRNVEVVNTYSKPNSGGYYSVQSSSFSSSRNVDGELKNERGAETKVNNNGMVTHYKVRS